MRSLLPRCMLAAAVTADNWPTNSPSCACDVTQVAAAVPYGSVDKPRREDAHPHAARAVYFMNFFSGARCFVVEPNTPTFVDGNSSQCLNPHLFAPRAGRNRTSLLFSCATHRGNLRCQWLHRVFCGCVKPLCALLTAWYLLAGRIFCGENRLQWGGGGQDAKKGALARRPRAQ